MQWLNEAASWDFCNGNTPSVNEVNKNLKTSNSEETDRFIEDVLLLNDVSSQTAHKKQIISGLAYRCQTNRWRITAASEESVTTHLKWIGHIIGEENPIYLGAWATAISTIDNQKQLNRIPSLLKFRRLAVLLQCFYTCEKVLLASWPDVNESI